MQLLTSQMESWWILIFNISDSCVALISDQYSTDWCSKILFFIEQSSSFYLKQTLSNVMIWWNQCHRKLLSWCPASLTYNSSFGISEPIRQTRMIHNFHFSSVRYVVGRVEKVKVPSAERACLISKWRNSWPYSLIACMPQKIFDHILFNWGKLSKLFKIFKMKPFD